MNASRFPDAPPQIATLPLDKRGFPVPWFVPWFDGAPEFRAVEPARIVEAERGKICWVCGRKRQGLHAFVIGPMCAVNRISAEPPSHLTCARFAVKACPFLSKPLAKRADISDLQHQAPAGIMIERNPGVTLIWGTQTYRAENHAKRGQPPSYLFRIGAPVKIEWYAYGRTATREEIVESIESGLPRLREVAELDGQAGIDELRRQIVRAVKLVPAE